MKKLNTLTLLTAIVVLLAASIGLQAAPSTNSGTLVIDRTTAVVLAPTNFMKANLLMGTNMVFVTNANGTITISSSASGSGSVTNVNFSGTPSVDWSTSSGTNLFSVSSGVTNDYASRVTDGTNAAVAFATAATNTALTTATARITAGTNAAVAYALNATNDVLATATARITAGTNAAVAFAAIAVTNNDTRTLTLGGGGTWNGTATNVSGTLTNNTVGSSANATNLGGYAIGRFRTNEATYYNVTHWGMSNNAVELTNTTIAAGSMLVTNPGASFTAADVGKWFMVANANGLGTNLLSIITNVISSTSLQLSNAATVGATNWQARLGWDICTAWNTMMTNINTVGQSADIFVPLGKYLVAGQFLQFGGNNFMQLWLPVQGISDAKYSIRIFAEARPALGGGVHNGLMPFPDSGAIFLGARSPTHGPIEAVLTNSTMIGYCNALTNTGAFGLNGVNVMLENLVFRTWDNQTLNPVNFSFMAFSDHISGCNSDIGWPAGRMSQPTFRTFGFITPNGQSSPGFALDNCVAVGYGSGFMASSDVTIDRFRSYLNNSIFTIGPAGYGGLNIGYVWSSYCPTGIVNNLNFGPWPGLNIEMLDFEVGNSNTTGCLPWMHYKNLLYDPNNLATGDFKYQLTANYGSWTNHGAGTTTIPDLFVGGDGAWFKPQRINGPASFRNGLSVPGTVSANNLVVSNSLTISSLSALTVTALNQASVSNLFVNPSGSSIRGGAIDVAGFSGFSFDAVGSFGASALTRANCGIWGNSTVTVMGGPPILAFYSGTTQNGYFGTAGGMTIGTTANNSLARGSLNVEGVISGNGSGITNIPFTALSPSLTNGIIVTNGVVFPYLAAIPTNAIRGYTSTATNWWIGSYAGGVAAIATNVADGGFVIKQLAP